jgi:hypothetical protein
MYDVFVINNGLGDTWANIKKLLPHARLVNEENWLSYCADQSYTRAFWTIPSDVTVDNLFDFSIALDEWDMGYAHVWPCKRHNMDTICDLAMHEPIALWPKRLVVEKGGDYKQIISEDGNIKTFSQNLPKLEEYDIFLLLGDSNRQDAMLERLRKKYPTIQAITKNQHTYQICANLSRTPMFWTVDDNIILRDDWEFDYRPTVWDNSYLHIWPIASSASGDTVVSVIDETVKLWPKVSLIRYDKPLEDIIKVENAIKIMDRVAGKPVPYDIFFVSYEEPNANENWENLKSRFPLAKRVHGVKGIAHAHKTCALLSKTDMFWTVDGDTVVDQDWNFSYRPTVWDKNYLHLWYSRNPVNDLVYGYGSVKLWPRHRVLDHNKAWIDFTTSIGDIKIIESPISETRFDSTPFESWKSAFRECVKLLENISTNQDDRESKLRLNAWINTEKFSENIEWCKKGAFDAIKWHESNQSSLYKINDFSWLKEKFDSEHR